MALTYTVIIKAGAEIEPTETTPGLIWIEPVTGSAYLRLGNWQLFATGSAIVDCVEDTYEKEAVVSATEPDAEVGLIWINSVTNEAFIYLNDWIPYAGG